jgi:hypothetical protein
MAILSNPEDLEVVVEATVSGAPTFDRGVFDMPIKPFKVSITQGQQERDASIKARLAKDCKNVTCSIVLPVFSGDSIKVYGSRDAVSGPYHFAILELLDKENQLRAQYRLR